MIEAIINCRHILVPEVIKEKMELPSEAANYRNKPSFAVQFGVLLLYIAFFNIKNSRQ